MCQAALRRLLQENGRTDLASRIPKLNSNMPRETIVPDAEFERMLRVCAPEIELCLLLAHEAALRSKATLELSRANCDFDGRRINGTTKGGTKYDIPMTKRLHERLLWFCAAAQSATEPLTAVFRPHRKELTANALRSAMAAARVRTGLTSTWGLHDVRRTAARNLYNVTGDIRKVQSLLGHKMLWTTCWYLGNALQNLSADDLEAATGNKAKEGEKIA